LIRILSLALAAALAVAPAALAADKTVQVTFAGGQTSKAIKSTIKGDHGVNYMLTVGAGQVMQVLFAPGNPSCYMNVYEPGADSAVHIGSTVGNEFAANPTKAGAYKIQVYLMRNAARRNETCKYSISFEVTGTAGAGRTAAAGAPSELAKGKCLYRFKDDGAIVTTSALKPGYWELIIQAKAQPRKAACTVNDDGTIADWVEMK
jgi:hypothetical protein